MRKLICSYALMLCASVPVFCGTSTTVTNTVIRKDPGGTPYHCPDGGTGCTVTTTTTTTNLITPNPGPGGGWVYTGTLTGSGSVVRSEVPVDFSLSDLTYTFPSGTFVQILSSSYPSLVGKIVNLSGVTSNSAGEFTVLIQ